MMRVYSSRGYMVRWRRGDGVAYVFADREAGDGDHIANAVDTIAVSRSGWTDVVEVKAVLARWLRERHTAA
ncbi:MAG: hypothetical protein ACRDTC_00910 [Pseudonocardiaceae bacterium]